LRYVQHTEIGQPLVHVLIVAVSRGLLPRNVSSDPLPSPYSSSPAQT